MISREDIKKLSSLSRINIDEKDEEKLVKDMESILSYIGQLSEVDVSNSDTFDNKRNVRNVMREDEIFDKESSSKEIISEAPKFKGGYVSVKKIL